MNFEEYAAKPLLAEAGIAIPKGYVAETAQEAGKIKAALGPCVVKAQVPSGKRGKAGGIKLANKPNEAKAMAEEILGMEIGGHLVERVLVERQELIALELYAAVFNDPPTKGPMVMFSTAGGMDIEEVAAETPNKLKSTAVDVREGFDEGQARTLVGTLDLGDAEETVIDALVKLYKVYVAYDAELLEINPLIVTKAGDVIASIASL